MPSAYRETILRHCRPATPVPTEQHPQLTALEGIRAVLFDVYGTMLISASGDVGTADTGQRESAFAEAMSAAGISSLVPEIDGKALLLKTIRAHHETARERGVDYPEVEIREVWRDVLAEIQTAGQLTGQPSAPDIERLAVEYEVRTNPLWPMPSLESCLAGLRAAGLRLGVVSNAQFFTPLMFPAMLDNSLEQLGFATDLQFYSYQFLLAKPGKFLYQRAAEALSSLEIAADEVLYVGNDLLNDVAPAQAVGFRTALFAGDARSLRLRDGDPRVEGVRPELVLTDLAQLPACLSL